MFKRGSLVAYAGRAAEVQGFMPFTLPSGRSVDCLVLLYRCPPRGVVRVPRERIADHVKRISKREADQLDANVPPALTLAAKHAASIRAAKAAKAADYGRMGGLAKAGKRAA